MNYSETINELFDPLIDLTENEAIKYLNDNEETIKDDIFAAIILFLGVSKPIYRKTADTIFNETKRVVEREFRSKRVEEAKKKGFKLTKKKAFTIDKNILAQIKMRNQYLFTRAKAFNQQVLKQEFFREKMVNDETVNMLFYVLNEKSDNHCEFCLENDKTKIYTVEDAPELPQKEGHGGVGWGCYCYYLPIRSYSELKRLIREYRVKRDLKKDWWKDPNLSEFFEDDIVNSELPN